MIVESMERSRPRHRPVLPALARTPVGLGHVRLAAPLGIGVPGLREEQPPVQRAGGLVGDRVHAHADLAVGYLAQRPAVLWRHPDRPAAELREAGVIITHAWGWIAAVMRSASRRRTGTGSQGDWLTNCCKACSSA